MTRYVQYIGFMCYNCKLSDINSICIPKFSLYVDAMNMINRLKIPAYLNNLYIFAEIYGIFSVM